MFSLVPWKKRDDNMKVWRDQELYPMARLRDDFERLWNRFTSGWEQGPMAWGESPWGVWDNQFEDSDKEYVFRAELPGFEPEDLEVKISGNMLSVNAEHRDEQKTAERSGYSYGSFHETFALPRHIEQDRIDARYHSGVLEIHLPKAEQAQGKRIEVKAN